MGAVKLESILLTSLSQIETTGGNVLQALKVGDVGYVGFGEAYFSWVSSGAVKAWKRHKLMTMNLVVPVGQVKFVFYLDGMGEVRVEMIGEDRYARITVPPGIWFGFQGLAKSQSLVLNLASVPHQKSEVERRALSAFKYDWD